MRECCHYFETVNNAIGKEEIKSIKFPLPPTLTEQISIANELERKMAEVEKMREVARCQNEAVEALPGAILREVFEFEEE